MNKHYNENDIQELLKSASQNIAPTSGAFDLMLSKLDTSVVKPSIHTKPVISTFSVFRFAGAFTAFVLVVLGVRNISTPLQNGITPQEGANIGVPVDGSVLALGTVEGTSPESPGSTGNNTGGPSTRSMSSTFAKDSAQTPEARAIESATLDSLAAESAADSELLALSPDI
jgi:hypothetical protein